MNNCIPYDICEFNNVAESESVYICFKHSYHYQAWNQVSIIDPDDPPTWIANPDVTQGIKKEAYAEAYISSMTNWFCKCKI